MATETAPQNSFNRDNISGKSMAKAGDELENGVSGGFDCNICLDAVQDPVVTLCGHLYCWPCIYRWIGHHNTYENQDRQEPQCPVCRSEVSQKTIVPLYVLGQTTNPGTEEEAPSEGTTTVPQRPSTPKYGVLGMPAQRPGRRGYQQHAPPPASVASSYGMTITTEISPSPTTVMLREMVSGRILGDLETLSSSIPDSYNIAMISAPQATTQATQADRSLSRICAFLFCSMLLSLLSFT